jgi:signal peptidase I
MIGIVERIRQKDAANYSTAHPPELKNIRGECSAEIRIDLSDLDRVIRRLDYVAQELEARMDVRPLPQPPRRVSRPLPGPGQMESGLAADPLYSPPELLVSAVRPRPRPRPVSDTGRAQAGLAASASSPQPKPLAPAAHPDASEAGLSSQTPPSRSAKKVLGILCNVVLAVFCVLLVAGAAMFALSNDPEKSFFGYRFYSVLTKSMTPQPDSPPGGFLAGDMIVVKMSDPQNIEVGDIVTFATDPSGSAYLTHRVVDIKTELDGQPGLWFITQGDANNAEDPPVAADRIIGKKVFSLPKAGALIQQVRDNPVPSLAFLAAAFGFIIALQYYFARSKAKNKTPNNTTTTCPPERAMDIDAPCQVAG